MTADCLGETGMSLKTKLTRVREKGNSSDTEETTHSRRGISQLENVSVGEGFHSLS